MFSGFDVDFWVMHFWIDFLGFPRNILGHLDKKFKKWILGFGNKICLGWIGTQICRTQSVVKRYLTIIIK